jgi:hypothetical protein
MAEQAQQAAEIATTRRPNRRCRSTFSYSITTDGALGATLRSHHAFTPGLLPNKGSHYLMDGHSRMDDSLPQLEWKRSFLICTSQLATVCSSLVFMTDKELKTQETAVARLVAILFGLPWLEIAADLWKVTRKLWHGLAHEGMYEVLEHEVTLELADPKGKRAIIRKRQKVRYLQNNIIAYQDQAWGDGRILVDYRCSPGIEADLYESGRKTNILISLREVKERGDIDEFNIQWEQQNGYLRPVEEWSSEISHRTKWLKLQIVFPTTRPPQKVLAGEYLTRRTKPLSQEDIRKLPDGRWIAVWETSKPRLHEQYALKWEW